VYLYLQCDTDGFNKLPLMADLSSAETAGLASILKLIGNRRGAIRPHQLLRRRGLMTNPYTQPLLSKWQQC
jgi:hypothetical protein